MQLIVLCYLFGLVLTSVSAVSFPEEYDPLIPCTKGYYRSSQNSTCVPCPKNSNSDKDGADHCECIDGYYRAPNEDIGMICTAPPDPIPNKLRIVGMCDTTAELAWDKPEEVGRDDFYYSINRTDPDTNEEIMINANYIDDRNVVTFKVTGLAPKTTYTFSVCIHNGVSQFDQINKKLRVVAQQATTRQGNVFMHNNMELSNNSVILREEIGEGEKALICQTLSDARCGGSSASPAMFFPNSTEVLPAGNDRTVYSTTGDGQVRLNRKLEDDSPLGLYYCQIPDSKGNIQKMFISLATIQLSREAPTCEPIRCSELESPANGDVTVLGFVIGSVSFYTCDINYQLEGRSIRICGSDGQWTGEAPTCEQVGVDCGDLSDIPDGEVDYTSSTVGSTATYTCNTGFELVGQRSCQSSGIWEGTVPSCQRVDCGSLLSPTNGQISVSSTTFGSTASYTCSSGYSLSGATVRTCQANGQWSGTAPVCVPVPTTSAPPPATTQQPTPSTALPEELLVVCPQLSDPIGGSVTISADVVPGSRAMYSCDDKHQLSGPFVRECQEDGTWSESEPTCEAIICPALIPPNNGNVNQFGNTPGSLALYGCDDNFELSGDMSRECGPNGQWTGEAPLCEATAIICPALSPPDNGNVNQLGNTPGSLALYACNDNFELTGNAFRECGPNGQWTGEAPLCEATIGCPPLEHPANGLVTLEGNSPGSVATYSCNESHSLLGSATSQCQSNEAWSNQPPTCTKIGFQLNGQFYASGSSLSLSSIGEGEGALLCVTDGTCCTPPNRAGEFHYPDNTLVRTRGSGDDLYRNRGEQLIRLHRRNGATSPTGIYKCEIPDSSGDIQEIFITLN